MEEIRGKDTTVPMDAGKLFCNWLEAVELLLRNENWYQYALGSIGANGWRYVFGLPCMAYRVTTTAYGKLKYTACYLLGGLISR